MKSTGFTKYIPVSEAEYQKFREVQNKQAKLTHEELDRGGVFIFIYLFYLFPKTSLTQTRTAQNTEKTLVDTSKHLIYCIVEHSSAI